MLANLLLVQDMFALGQINHVFWSIAVEWHIYFFFPLFVLAFRRNPRSTTVAVIVLSAVTATLVRNTFLAGANIQFLALFMLGMLAATLAAGGFSPRPFHWTVYAAVSLLLVALSRHPAFNHIVRKLVLADLLVGGAIFMALLQCTSQSFRPKKVLEAGPLVWIGTFSYSLYLIHAPFIHIVWQYFVHPLSKGPALSILALILVGTPVSIALAYVFFLVFERPFMSQRQKAAENHAAHTLLPEQSPTTS